MHVYAGCLCAILRTNAVDVEGGGENVAVFWSARRRSKSVLAALISTGHGDEVNCAPWVAGGQIAGRLWSATIAQEVNAKEVLRIWGGWWECSSVDGAEDAPDVPGKHSIRKTKRKDAGNCEGLENLGDLEDLVADSGVRLQWRKDVVVEGVVEAPLS